MTLIAKNTGFQGIAGAVGTKSAPQGYPTVSRTANYVATPPSAAMDSSVFRLGIIRIQNAPQAPENSNNHNANNNNNNRRLKKRISKLLNARWH